jgi:preprotein translocase subunit YajC
METQQVAVLVIGLVIMAVFVFLPQWQARRRRRKRMADLAVGDEVMTVGGIIGKLTYLDEEGNRAGIEVSPGVEIHVVLAAISRATGPSEPS